MLSMLYYGIRILSTGQMIEQHLDEKIIILPDIIKILRYIDLC